jgi:hypothetical protein
MRLDEKEPDDPQLFAAASFAAFPEPLNAGEKYISGNLHPGSEQAQEGECVAHLHFAVDRAPSSDPPKTLVGLNERVGGMAKMLENIRMHWPAKETRLDVRGTYLIKDLSRLQPAVRVVPPAAVINTNGGGDGISHQLKPIFSMFSWHVEPPSGPVDNLTVTIAPSQQEEPKPAVMLLVSGSMSTNVTHDILDRVDGELWQGILPFLTSSA